MLLRAYAVIPLHSIPLQGNKGSIKNLGTNHQRGHSRKSPGRNGASHHGCPGLGIRGSGRMGSGLGETGLGLNIGLSSIGICSCGPLPRGSLSQCGLCLWSSGCNLYRYPSGSSQWPGSAFGGTGLSVGFRPTHSQPGPKPGGIGQSVGGPAWVGGHSLGTGCIEGGGSRMIPSKGPPLQGSNPYGSMYTWECDPTYSYKLIPPIYSIGSLCRKRPKSGS